MNGVVDGYTRHFFNVAYCMVIHDNEQPPRTLCEKLHISQRNNIKAGKQEREKAAFQAAVNAMNKTDETISRTTEASFTCNGSVKGPFLQSVENATATASQVDDGTVTINNSERAPRLQSYDDPNTFPVVVCSEEGDLQIAVEIQGMNCPHCVRIIESVLTGFDDDDTALGDQEDSNTDDLSSPPIPGLLGCVVDLANSMAIVKIAQSTSAKRISHEMGELLKMVGYEMEAKQFNVNELVSIMNDKFGKDYNLMDMINLLISIYELDSNTAGDNSASSNAYCNIYGGYNRIETPDIFSAKCICPVDGIKQHPDCPR